MNDRNKARTQDIYFDIMLNHLLFQNLKPIGNGEFNCLIHFLTKKKTK
jgi:hypothetical protein